MARDPNVLTFGEDVGYFGGVVRVTEHLQKKYGMKRCFDAPINENGIAAVAIGMAAYGLRPVIEIQFADYMYPAYDQLVSEAARIRYRSAGEFTVPITVRMPYGGGIRGGQTHSQSARSALHARRGPEDRDPVDALRCEGPAHLRHRRRRSGDLHGAQAHL